MCDACVRAGSDGAHHLHGAAAAPRAGLETWSLDQIADHLLTGYWRTEAPRAFDAGADRRLSYDASGLSAEGRALARAALDEWSAVTGVAFHEVPGWQPSAVLRERGDAAASTATAARLAPGEAFDGAIGPAGDRDWIGIELDPWQVVTITLTGSDALGAPRPVLRDARGVALPFAWQADGATAEITIATRGEAARGFVEVAGRGGAQGDYRLTLREPGARGGADIVFDDDRAGAYASFSASGSQIRAADINVAASWIAAYGAAPGTYGFQTYLHEVGHALGLGHAGDYNGSGRYADDALYANDSWQASVMSYFDQAENTAVAADRAFVVTPMAADVLAARALYGAAPVRAGDTVYGESSTAGGALDLVAAAGRPLAFTILDTGGRDRLDLSSQTAAQRVDLRPEAVSDVLGHRGTMTIARGTILEDATTGSGDDRVIGNGAANRLDGGAGSDRLEGLGGDDTLLGGDGDDRLLGGGGADRLDGGAGSDDLDGGAGADVLIGGLGADAIAGGSGRDRLLGGDGDDRLVGGSGRDDLDGGEGDDALKGAADGDRLSGGAGADRLDGGAGADVLLGGGGGDVVAGGSGDDVLAGGDGADALIGGEGHDRLAGGEGHDRITGGTGRDALRGGAGDDALSGGGGRDVMAGDAGDDRLAGGGGADALGGGGGDDRLSGEGGADRLAGGRGSDVLSGGDGRDRLAGGSGGDRLDGGAGRDVLRGQGGADLLAGDGARDRLLGGAGDDRIAGGRGRDDLRGGAGDDVLWGGAPDATGAAASRDGRDVLRGGRGDDRLTGGGGADALHGHRGADVLDGGRGRDTLVGGAGRDTLTGGAGADVFVFAGAFGRDRIEDFAAHLRGERIDLARVRGLDGFGDLDLRERAEGVLLDAGEAGRILLADVALRDLDAGDFLF